MIAICLTIYILGTIAFIAGLAAAASRPTPSFNDAKDAVVDMPRPKRPLEIAA